jgi:twitching motility protein PilT
MASESILAVISQKLLKRKGGGRVAAFEVMLGIPAVSNLIREEKSFQLSSIIQTNTNIGMITMSQSIEQLVSNNLVDSTEAMRAEEDTDVLQASLKKGW